MPSSVKNNHRDFLKLLCVPDLGTKRTNDILRVNNRLARSLDEFFGLTEGALADSYHLPKKAITALTSQQQNLAEHATKVEELLRRHDISFLVRGDDEYPEFLGPYYDGEPPPFLFCLGDIGLLKTSKAAVVNSRALNHKGRGFEVACSITDCLIEHALTLVTSFHKPSYALTAHKVSKSKVSPIIVLDCGILRALNYLIDGETRRLGASGIASEDSAFDATKQLLISPFKPHHYANKGGGPQRDRLVVALADIIIAVEIRKGGVMERECLDAHRKKKQVHVCRFGSHGAASSGNLKLLEEGCEPLTVDSLEKHLSFILDSISRKKPSVGHVPPVEDLARRQSLGQFFTPPEIADFMWDILALFHGGEIPKEAKAIDPAVGEGVFLLSAISKKLIKEENLVGVDIDERLLSDWRRRFNEHPKVSLFLTDGLQDNPWLGIMPEQFDIVIGNPPYGGEGLTPLAKLLLPVNQGERPGRVADKSQQYLFGIEPEDHNVEHKEEDSSEVLTPDEGRNFLRLAMHLATKFQSWKRGKFGNNDTETFASEENNQSGASQMMMGFMPELEKSASTRKIVEAVDEFDASKLAFSEKSLSIEEQEIIRRLSTFPIEILFVERFVQLCRPDGYIVVIVPDGILANANTQYFRDWLMEHGELKAVISLPRNVFIGGGANAKTSALFVRKYTVEEREEVLNHRRKGDECAMPAALLENEVLMASPTSGQQSVDLHQYLESVMAQVRPGKNPQNPGNNAKFRECHGACSMKSKTSTSSWTVMITQGELARQKRLDPWFYDPNTLELLNAIKSKYSVVNLGEFISEMRQGDVPREKYGEKYESSGKLLLRAENLLETGVDPTYETFISEANYQRLARAIPSQDDIIIGRAGVASTGRIAVFDKRTVDEPCTISSHLNVLRLETEKINPLFVALFLKSRFGQLQIKRFQSGTGSAGISFEFINSLLLPVLSKRVQGKYAEKVKKAMEVHRRAMRAKRRLIERTGDRSLAENDPDVSRRLSEAKKLLDKAIQELEMELNSD